jgi:hypothetical protein
MRWQKNMSHLNNDSMVKDLPLNMKVKGGERFKPPHLHPRLVGLSVYMNEVFNEGS